MTRLASYTMRTAGEALARVSVVQPNPELRTDERSELRFVSIRYPAAGRLTYPALGFYAVSFRNGGAQVHEEGWRTGLQPVAARTMWVQTVNRIVEYAWDSAHEAWAMCIEQAEVERAASERELLNPQRIEILSRTGTDLVAQRLVEALTAQARLGSHPAQQLACSALRKAMATHLLSSYGAFAARKRRSSTKALSPYALKRAIAYLEDNVARECRLEELADHVGVSSFVIEEQFRRAAGASPARYLLRARVERAKSLLAYAPGGVAQVAQLLGFYDVAAFRKLFRRFTGVTPEDFALLHGRSPDFVRSGDGTPS